MASTGLLRPHQSRISLLQRVIDAALILLTLYGATYLPRVTFDQEAVRDAYVMAGLLAVVTFTFVAESSRLYASWRGSTVVAEIISQSTTKVTADQPQVCLACAFSGLFLCHPIRIEPCVSAAHP